jgi:Bifunctional DNA primase/polymerase, N-terminal
MFNRPENNNANDGRTQAETVRHFGGESLLDAGLRAAKRGWSIFPCNGKKRPLTPNGFYDATTDPTTITAWTTQWPGALWGRALPPEVVVIDLDMKHGENGIRDFTQLQNCAPSKFDAPRIQTATGGIHVYTDAAGRDFKNSVGEIASGIDTRTGGGYVIIPSGPQSGYRWLSGPDTPARDAGDGQSRRCGITMRT